LIGTVLSRKVTMDHDVIHGEDSYGVGWSKVIPSRTAEDEHTLRFADGEFKLLCLLLLYGSDRKKENTIGS